MKTYKQDKFISNFYEIPKKEIPLLQKQIKKPKNIPHFCKVDQVGKLSNPCCNAKITLIFKPIKIFSGKKL